MLRPLVCASLLLAIVAGCASGGSSSSAASDIASSDLSARTVVKGSVALGETIALGYEPSEYAVNGLPYLGVTFEATDASVANDASRTITVAGNFPGAPHLLVVDPSFKVLAETDGVRTDGGAEAKLSLPASVFAGRNMVLIQDARWNLPMELTVSAE